MALAENSSDLLPCGSSRGARYVTTLNSHGQAQALSCHPDVATMHTLPQGVRATVTMPLPRIIGHWSSLGLALVEVGIGTLSNFAWRRRLHLWTTLLLFHCFLPVRGMQPAIDAQPNQALAVQHWGSSTPRDPLATRIWTYTCDAPTEVPYVGSPDINQMHLQVSLTG